MPNEREMPAHAVAVVGMSGRFPGASGVDELWRNLAAGVESITFFESEELRRAGEEPRLLSDPRYVPAKAVVEGEDLFDAAFFGFSPREAEIRDPQHRLFLECSWEALEDAACDPDRFDGLIGVYAGAGSSSYAWNVLAKNPELMARIGGFQLAMANDKDYLATLTSYKLRLRGPSFSVQCACSTSLVAIHLACGALAAYECDLALAGGVTVGSPQRQGYLYQEGGILSPDGHCRAFDARARGTAPGGGVGVVALKRLGDALEDGDSIHAVVRGSAVNNDGGAKVGYTAPSVEGQAEVIAAAQAMAEVGPESITYIEAHGTGTPLGDPIEVAALTEAFGEIEEHMYCALGSVKSNFGHLDAAAGVAGFIKVVLALRERQIPPSVGFERPNPAIDFASTPFRVSERLTSWETDRLPRRAGVSSFGIGGTNAHVILEEAENEPPMVSAAGTAEMAVAGDLQASPLELLPLSARTPTALEVVGQRLADHLEAYPEADLRDVAHTLSLGRKAFEHRRVVLGSQGSRQRVVEALRTPLAEVGLVSRARETPPPVVFLLPGQGVQRPGMASGLYRAEPVFREGIDRCREILELHLRHDSERDLPRVLGELLLGDGGRGDVELGDTELAQPALFALEHSLAQLWISWGVEPEALLGHSVGELVAACLAGVFTLQEGLALVAARGRLMASMPPGAMVGVSLDEAEVEPHLSDGLSLAAVNAPGRVTVSGPVPAVERLLIELGRRGVSARRLRTAHAFHSAATEPLMEPFRQLVEVAEFQPPSIPFLSNVTGTWITKEEATDPDYWTRHMRQPVRFGMAASELLEEPHRAFLEVGPGRSMCALLAHQPAARGRLTVPSMPRPGEEDAHHLLTAAGRLWIEGVEIDWRGHRPSEGRRRLHLPTYPFERQRYWAGESVRKGPARESMQPPTGAVASTGSRTAPALSSLHPRPALATPFSPPREGVESTLAEVWSELLGLGPVGRRDDFFELGGSSLLGVQLMSAIEERLGKELSVSVLSEGGATVAELARKVRAHDSTSLRVELRPSRGEASEVAPPLVLVHPIGGEVLAYLDLARALPSNRSVWALRARGLLPGEEPGATIDSIAREYVAELRRAELPYRGPHLLGGWSFGGLVAVEMARHLLAEGEEVERVVLIDSAPPAESQDLDGAHADGSSAELERLGLLAFIRDLGGLDGEGELAAESLAEQLDDPEFDPDEIFDRLVERATAAGRLPTRSGAARLRRLFAVFRAHLTAAAAYRPCPIEVPVLLIEAEQRPPSRDPRHGPRQAWGEALAGPVETRVVPGDHYSLLRPPSVARVAALVANTEIPKTAELVPELSIHEEVDHHAES